MILFPVVKGIADDSQNIFFRDSKDIVWEQRKKYTYIQGVIGHGYIHGVEYSKDGNFLILATSFGVEIYDKDNQLIKRIYTNDMIRDATMSPDGKQIITVSRDGFKSWDIQSNQVKLLRKTRIIPRQVIYSPDGNYIAVSGQQFFVNLIHTKSNHMENILRHNNFITSIAFHPSSKSIVSAGRDNKIKLLSMDSREEKILFTTDDTITSLAFSPDGKYLFIAVDDRKFIIYNINSGNSNTFKLSTSPFYSMDISQNNSYLAAQTKKNKFILWDLNTNRIILKINPRKRLSSRFLNNNSVAFHPTGNSVAYITEGNNIAIVTVSDRKIKYLKNHSAFGSFSLSSGGDYILGIPGQLINEQIRLIRLKDNSTKIIKNKYKALQSVFHITRNLFIIGGKGKLSSYYLSSAELDYTFRHPSIGKILSMATSPYHDILAMSTSKNNVLLFDLYQKKIVKSIQLETPALCLSFNHSGKQLIIGNSDVILYDMKRNYMKSLYSYIGGSYTIATSPTRNWVAIGGFRNMIHIVDSDSGQVRDMPKRSFGKAPVAFSSDGRYIAFAGYKSVGIWDTFRNRKFEFGGYKEFIESLWFSPDGHYIYSLGKEDGLIYITKIR